VKGNQVAEQIASEPGVHVINCIVCNKTCHLTCAYKDDEDKRLYIAMDRDGHCRNCPGKCLWSEHKNQPFHWEYKTVEQAKNADELRAKYADATSKHLTSQEMIAKLEAKYRVIQQKLRENVELARRHVNRLGKIAARPNPLSSTDYIDLLIQAEESEKKPGWDTRIRYLRDAREAAVIAGEMGDEGDWTPSQFRSRTRRQVGSRGKR
jgi:hypothetical protein